MKRKELYFKCLVLSSLILMNFLLNCEDENSKVIHKLSFSNLKGGWIFTLDLRYLESDGLLNGTFTIDHQDNGIFEGSGSFYFNGKSIEFEIHGTIDTNNDIIMHWLNEQPFCELYSEYCSFNNSTIEGEFWEVSGKTGAQFEDCEIFLGSQLVAVKQSQ